MHKYMKLLLKQNKNLPKQLSHVYFTMDYIHGVGVNPRGPQRDVQLLSYLSQVLVKYKQ